MRRVMRNLLLALAHCGLHGVVHRDIKPEVGPLPLRSPPEPACPTPPGIAARASITLTCDCAACMRWRMLWVQNLLLARPSDLTSLKLCDFGLAVILPPGRGRSIREAP